MKVEETVLPGLGRKVTFKDLKDGHSVAIVTMDDGAKAIYLNPESVNPTVIKLDPEESRLLGQAILSEWLPKTLIDYVSRSFQGGVAMDQYRMSPKSPVVGHTIMDSRLRSESGALIIAIVRAGKQIFNPAPTTVIQNGDVLILVGDDEQLHKARKIFTNEKA